jgi:hypothetical protein
MQIDESPCLYNKPVFYYSNLAFILWDRGALWSFKIRKLTAEHSRRRPVPWWSTVGIVFTFLAASTECSAGSNDHFVVGGGGGGCSIFSPVRWKATRWR